MSERPEIIYTRDLQKKVCEFLGIDSKFVETITMTPHELEVRIFDTNIHESTTWHYRVRNNAPRASREEKAAQPSVLPQITSP